MSPESISALLDGECSAEELDALLDAFENSAESRQQWTRMCAVRDVLHGSQSRFAVDVTAGVMAAITADVSQAETVATPASSSGKVVVLRPRRAISNWRQPLVGLAAAASVAGAVAIGVNSLLARPAVEGTSGQVALANDHGRGSPALTPVVARVDNNDVQETGWGQLDAESARQLSGYMMEHSSYRAEQGMGGSLSYARMAVRPADYRPAVAANGSR